MNSQTSPKSVEGSKKGGKVAEAGGSSSAIDTPKSMVSSSQNKPSSLQMIDLDYIRPCNTRGTPLVFTDGANDQRYYRLKKSMKKMGMDPAVADTLPNQNAKLWDAEVTRAEIWTWAEQNIPGWVGQFTGGIDGTGAKKAEDVAGKEGKGGKRSLPLPNQVVASTKGKKDGGEGAQLSINDDDEDEDAALAVAGPSRKVPSQKHKQNTTDDDNDDAYSVHSTEDPTDFDLQVMANAQLERDIEAAFAPVPNDVRDKFSHYIDRTDRDWEPEYDTEPPGDDDLPFAGYFTTYGKVKQGFREKAPVILGLVKKSERREEGVGGDNNDEEGTIRKERLGELGLEVLPVLKKVKRRS